MWQTAVANYIINDQATSKAVEARIMTAKGRARVSTERFRGLTGGGSAGVGAPGFGAPTARTRRQRNPR